MYLFGEHVDLLEEGYLTLPRGEAQYIDLSLLREELAIEILEERGLPLPISSQ